MGSVAVVIVQNSPRSCESGESPSGKSGEISQSGIKDENLIPFLHQLHGATLFTQDKDFFKQGLSHQAYGLVYLAVPYKEVAEFIRRFLKHPAFNTQSKRMGLVANRGYW